MSSLLQDSLKALNMQDLSNMERVSVTLRKILRQSGLKQEDDIFKEIAHLRKALLSAKTLLQEMEETDSNKRQKS
jgi:hypothetical protein